MDLFDLADIYDILEKTLPGAEGGNWDDRDPLFAELKSRSWQRRKAVMENPEAKLHHIIVGLKDKHEGVAAAAARSPLLEPEHLRLVMQSTSPLVRREALHNPKLPSDLIDRALADPELGWRDIANLAQNPALQHHQLLKVLMAAKAQEGSQNMRGSYGTMLGTVLNHPQYDKSALNEQAQQALQGEDTEFLDKVAASEHLSPQTISAIIKRGAIKKEYGAETDHIFNLKDNPNFNGDHILEMLQNEHLPNRLLREVTNPDDTRISQLLDHRHISYLFSPKSAQDWSERLSSISTYNVNDFLRNKKWWTPESIAAIANNPYVGDDVADGVVKHHASPEQAFDILNNQTYPLSKKQAAAERLLVGEYNEDVTPEQKQAAAASVHDALVKYRSTDDSATDDGNFRELASVLANNETANPEHLDWMARTFDPSHYGPGARVWNHPNLPLNTIQWAATHADINYRQKAAENARLPEQERAKLLRDPTEHVQNVLLQHQAKRFNVSDWEHILLNSPLGNSHLIRSAFSRNDQLRPIPEAYQMALANPSTASMAAQGNIPTHIAHAALDSGNLTPDVHHDILTNSRVELRPQDMEYMINSDQPSLWTAAAEHKNVTIDHLRRMMDMPQAMDNHSLASTLRDKLKSLDPDSGYEKVHVRFGTGKLRKIRDYILKNGSDEMKPNEIQKKIPLPGNIDWNQMRSPSGNISAKKIQTYLDATPAKTYNWSKGQWTGAQRHSRERQNVFQLNLTSEMTNKLKEQGLWDYWKKLSEPYIGGHPVHEHTLGWVRHTGTPGKGIFIDEVQSDYMNSPHSKAVSQTKHAFTHGDSGVRNHAQYGDKFDEELAARLKNAHESALTEYGPEEQHAQFVNIAFGDKHSNELLHEAFQQHLRDEGHAGTKIAVHSVQSKSKLNGWENGGEAPVHGKIAYEQHPKKMGFEPGSYHKDNMPTMSEEANVPQGEPVWQDELRKYEKLKGLIKEMILAKMEKYDADSEG